ncbi:MAG: tetratricopeptide repeat protein [Rhodothermales bacterium]
MRDGRTTQWMLRGAVHVAVILSIVCAGCATSTSTSTRPEISSDLRTANRSSADESQSRSSRSQQLFLRGMTEARLGHHEEALNLYARALQLTPNTAAILAAVAESHAAIGDDSAALYALREARKADPGNVHYALQLAELHRSRDASNEAARIYNEILDAHPHHTDALHDLARVHMRSGELEQALTAYERLLDVLGTDRDIQNQVLHLYARLEDFEGMERMLDSMLEQQPSDPQLHRMLAEVFVKQDRREKAVDELLESLEWNPGDIQSMLNLAEVYRDLDRDEDADAVMQRIADVQSTEPSQLLSRAETLYARSKADAETRATAIQLLNRVLDVNPRNEQALRMLGNLYFDAGSYEDAGDYLYRALDANPRNPDVWERTADAFLQARAYDRAARVADEGLLLFPGSIPLLDTGGHARMHAHENDAAIDRFEEAIRLVQDEAPEFSPKLTEYYAALGLLYSRIGSLEQSDRYFEQAIEANPDNAAAINHYAYRLAQGDRQLDRALDLARRAVDMNPDEPSYLDTFGWVLFRLERYEDALGYLLEAAAHPDASSAVFEHLRYVYEALGRPADAGDAWERSLQLNPESERPNERLGKE